MNVFWLVWADNGGVPTVKHDTLRSARAEAERLAQRTEGRTFHVLQLVGSAIVQRVQWQEPEPANPHHENCACVSCMPF